MRIRLLMDRAGNGRFWSYGEEVDWRPDEEAWTLVRTGQAEIVGPETAVVAASHNAVLDRPKPRTMRGQKDARVTS